MGTSDLRRRQPSPGTDPRHAGAGRPRLLSNLLTNLLHGARDLFPGYFALVMATGIVSIACSLLGLRLLALALVPVAWGAYLVLWAMTLVRIIRFPGRIASDISQHQRGAGFFTVVAGTCVLGSQATIVAGEPHVGIALWYLGLGLWAVVMYTFFTAIMVRAEKPSPAKGLSGVWLVSAVATQSIVVLRGALGVAVPPEAIQFLCLVFFMMGTMLYLMIITLIFLRLIFMEFAPSDLGHAYWINMGAVAISTLAGAVLVGRSETWPVLAAFRPILLGMTVFFWSVASWWIPLLLALGAWRFLVRGDRPRYEPHLWSMVFPLGMYTAASIEMGLSLDLPMLLPVADVTIWAALAAWLASFAGMVVRVVRVAIAAPEGQ